MAEPIQYSVPPPRTETTPREELDHLLNVLHEHGMLRFAADLAAANTQVAQVVVQGLNNEGVMNAIKNLSIILMALSRIPPTDFYKLMFAAKDGVLALNAARSQTHDDQAAPGLTGAYHMLHDEDLWHALSPLAAALKAFANGMKKEIKNPISDFSGKPGSTS